MSREEILRTHTLTHKCTRVFALARLTVRVFVFRRRRMQQKRSYLRCESRVNESCFRFTGRAASGDARTFSAPSHPGFYAALRCLYDSLEIGWQLYVRRRQTPRRTARAHYYIVVLVV